MFLDNFLKLNIGNLIKIYKIFKKMNSNYKRLKKNQVLSFTIYSKTLIQKKYSLLRTQKLKKFRQ